MNSLNLLLNNGYNPFTGQSINNRGLGYKVPRIYGKGGEDKGNLTYSTQELAVLGDKAPKTDLIKYQDRDKYFDELIPQLYEEGDNVKLIQVANILEDSEQKLEDYNKTISKKLNPTSVRNVEGKIDKIKNYVNKIVKEKGIKYSPENLKMIEYNVPKKSFENIEDSSLKVMSIDQIEQIKKYEKQLYSIEVGTKAYGIINQKILSEALQACQFLNNNEILELTFSTKNKKDIQDSVQDINNKTIEYFEALDLDNISQLIEYDKKPNYIVDLKNFYPTSEINNIIKQYSGTTTASASSFEKAYNNEKFGQIIYKNLFGSSASIDTQLFIELKDFEVLAPSIIKKGKNKGETIYEFTQMINYVPKLAPDSLPVDIISKDGLNLIELKKYTEKFSALLLFERLNDEEELMFKSWKIQKTNQMSEYKITYNKKILEALQDENDKYLVGEDISPTKFKYIYSWYNLSVNIPIGGNKFPNYIGNESLQDFIKSISNLTKLTKIGNLQGANSKSEIIEYVKNLQEKFIIGQNNEGYISTFKPSGVDQQVAWDKIDSLKKNKKLFYNCFIDDAILNFDYQKWWTKMKKIFGEELIHPIQILKIEKDYYNKLNNKYGDESSGGKVSNSLGLPLWEWNPMKLGRLKFISYGKEKKPTRLNAEQIEEKIGKKK